MLKDLEPHESQYGHLMNEDYKSRAVSSTLAPARREQHCDHCECFLLPDEYQLCADCEEGS